MKGYKAFNKGLTCSGGLNMPELKPCPFCGGEGVITDEDCYGFTDNDWMVYCENCQTYVGFGLQCETPEEAAEAWNRRTE